MKDFETIEIALADGVLYIGTETSSGVKSCVSTKEDILRCISNYFEMYVFEKTNFNYVQEIIPDHESALWYGGRVVNIEYKGYQFHLDAVGEVRVVLYDDARNELARVKDKYCAGRFSEEMNSYIKNDTELYKLIGSGKLELFNNNWWELSLTDPSGVWHDLSHCCDSDIFTEALEEVQKYFDEIIISFNMEAKDNE